MLRGHCQNEVAGYRHYRVRRTSVQIEADLRPTEAARIRENGSRSSGFANDNRGSRAEELCHRVGAGVDMERPEPVETALVQFESLVDELDRLLD